MELGRNRVHVDWLFLVAVLVLVVMGVLAMYSTSWSRVTGNTDREFFMHLVWLGVGIIAFLAISAISYNKYVELAPTLYVIGILLLVATLLIGVWQRNIKAWIGFGALTFQPSELVKIFTIITLARFLNFIGDQIADIRNFFITFLIILPPIGLIGLQPDFGTGLVFIPICFGMLFIAGARIGHIMSLIVLSLLGFGIPMVVAYYKETGKMADWLIQLLADNRVLLTVSVVLGVIALVSFVVNFFVRTRAFIKFALAVAIIPIGLVTAASLNSYLQPYQRKRIVVFVDPEMDYYGAGYNIIQSKIAIGSGGFLGKGYLRGTQNQLAFLPEKKTDFVFSSIGEEWGFFGVFILLSAYALLIWRGVMIVYRAKDMVGSLIAAGILSMIVFHVFINIGMATGMMPVTGLPLPFISYGGSALVCNLIAVALLFNIEIRRYVH